MTENSTSPSADVQHRADITAGRIARLGVPKQELAAKAGIDRGTLGRALKADPAISERTWVKIDRVLTTLEDELGVAAVSTPAMTASGETASAVVTSTVEYAGATITLSGRADAVADAIRRVIGGD